MECFWKLKEQQRPTVLSTSFDCCTPCIHSGTGGCLYTVTHVLVAFRLDHYTGSLWNDTLKFHTSFAFSFWKSFIRACIFKISLLEEEISLNSCLKRFIGNSVCHCLYGNIRFVGFVDGRCPQTLSSFLVLQEWWWSGEGPGSTYVSSSTKGVDLNWLPEIGILGEPCKEGPIPAM